jgi:hypothetical protein
MRNVSGNIRMRITITILLIIFIGLTSKGQLINSNDLFGGKWKYKDIPDSIKWFDSSLHLCPNNPSFWFKDSAHVDVVWNGFYFRDQDYAISKTKNLLFVYIDSIYENVSGFSCVFKPVKSGHMKLQYYKAQREGEIPWNDDETWYNTDNVYLFNFRPK